MATRNTSARVSKRKPIDAFFEPRAKRIASAAAPPSSAAAQPAKRTHKHPKAHYCATASSIDPPAEPDQTRPPPSPSDARNANKDPKFATTATEADLRAACAEIRAHKGLTAYRRRVLLLLAQVPRGRWTTYQALANAAAPPRGSARATGTAMKNNLFAPVVPCHRVLTRDGGIGGFHGQTAGQMLECKRDMLEQEGVRFDGRGRAGGVEFTGFEAVEE